MAASVPVELRGGPIFVAHARRLGWNWNSLQTKDWRRLSRGQYAWARVINDTWLTLRAVEQRMPSDYAFSGATAAWLFGLDLPPCEPVEVTVRRELSVRARSGIKVRRTELPPSDVTTFRGFQLTTPLRTVCDLGSRRDLVEAVVAVDMVLRAGLSTLPELEDHIDTHAGAKGIKRLRRAARLTDPRSESPMETRLRIELIKARLPHPCVQADLFDRTRRLLARVDLYYPDRKLAIEYDGVNHKDRIAEDARRQNALVNAGYHILRFTAADLRNPASVVAQVRHARAVLPQIVG